MLVALSKCSLMSPQIQGTDEADVPQQAGPTWRVLQVVFAVLDGAPTPPYTDGSHPPYRILQPRRLPTC
jgi:hypothetical protein